jgi:hypothetical protein
VPEPTDIPTTVVLVLDAETGVVLARVAVREPDLATIDALLRIRLTAARAGRRVRVRDAPEGLRELLELVGLSDALVLEPRRQAEGREQLRVDEVMQPGDPLA